MLHVYLEACQGFFGMSHSSRVSVLILNIVLKSDVGYYILMRMKRFGKHTFEGVNTSVKKF